MTKQKKKGMIWMLLLILVLIAGYFLTRHLNEKIEEKGAAEEEEVSAIVALNVSEIRSFSYRYTDAETGEVVTLQFKKEGDLWICENNEEVVIEQSKIETMLSAVSPLYAVRVINEEVDHIVDEEYGFDDPANELVFTDSDGNETILLIGGQNNTTTDYYLKNKNTSAVYTVSSSLISSFDYSLEELEEEIDDTAEDE